SRGNRRSFTIASSPHEDQVKIGIKFYEPSSEFKKSLLSLKSGSTIHASALSGEFVLPSDANKKLLFMAGGIGITPFRSMIKDLSLNKQKRDIVLFYFANESSEILYKNVWDEAKHYGVKLVALTNKERLDETLLSKHAPDYKDRACYLSGPPPMVRGYEKMLRSLGVSLSAIKSDYFSGY
ncbi:MAG: ferredoxin--NADP reductase, partial [Segetibacter sp.]